MIILRNKNYSKTEWTEEDYDSYAERQSEDYEKELDKNLKQHRNYIYMTNTATPALIGGVIGASGKGGSFTRSTVGSAIGTAVGAGLTAAGRKIKKSRKKEESAKKELVTEYKKAEKKALKTENPDDIQKADEYRKAADPKNTKKNRKLMIRLTGKKNIYGW